MAGGFGSDHGNIDGSGRLDGAETNVEAVGEHERFAGREMGSDGVAIEFGLLGVGGENHDHIGPGSGFGGSVDKKSFLLGFGSGRAARWQSYTDGDAAVAEIQRVGVTLRAVTEDGDLFGLDKSEVCCIVVVEICHSFPFRV